MEAEKKLEELGHELPGPPVPAGRAGANSCPRYERWAGSMFVQAMFNMSGVVEKG